MAPKLLDRPLTFAVPPVGAPGALLPQQAALGTTARIRQTAPDYFNVMVQEHGNDLGEMRLYIVRKHIEDGTGTWPKGKASWIVEAPSSDGEGYRTLTVFNGTPERLRVALGWAVRYLTGDWIIEVREGGRAR